MDATTKTTLWRAADDQFISGSASFAARRQDAEAYLAGRNPGYGGEKLWRLDIEATGVLDLAGHRDPIGRLCRIAGCERPGATGADEWVASAGYVREALAAAGYRWVCVDESYPEETVTWIWVGADPTDIEDAMVEVSS